MGGKRKCDTGEHELNSADVNTHPLLLGTTRVCPLKLGDLLIIERDRSTTVPFFTDKVEPGRRLMTT
jgi:hypothetical protein